MIKRIYWAAPLFTDEQRDYNLKCTETLEKLGFEVYLPQRDTGMKDIIHNDGVVYAKDIIGLQGCDAVVAVFDGYDCGTMFELGYADRMGKKLYGIGECLNCMFLHVKKYPTFETLMTVLKDEAVHFIQLPQVMWVWNSDESEKQKAYVIYIANESDFLTDKKLKGDDGGLRDYPVMTITENFKHCAVIDEG